MEPYCKLYDSIREAIKAAADAASVGERLRMDDRQASTSGRRQEDNLLERQLDRFAEEAHKSTKSAKNVKKQRLRPSEQQLGEGRDSRHKRPRQQAGEQEKVPKEEAFPSCNSEIDGEKEAIGDCVDGRREKRSGWRDDECLSLVAEAFADELDLLRKDAHFGSSARIIAAMADMTRCLAGGLDRTEQMMLLDSATR